jgi:hypothetical protein
MSTVTAPSAARRAPSWAEVAARANSESVAKANLIPRSVQPYAAGAGSPAVASPEYRHHASQVSAAFDTPVYNKLNINIPMDTYSGFSVKLTHPDGKVQEIVTRFESLVDCDGSDDIRVHADNAYTRASSSSTVHRFDTGPDNSHVRRIEARHHTDDDSSSTLTETSRSSTIVPQSPERRKHAASSVSDFTALSKTQSPQGKGELIGSPTKSAKSSVKGKGPMLATAQRAMQRAHRKTASQSDSPTEADRKPLRGAFLTKDAVAAVESDITSPSPVSPHNKVRPSPSTIKIRASPTKISRRSVHDLKSPTFLVAGESGRPASVVSSAGGTPPFKTAENSPVSDASKVSQSSFRTACSQLPDDIFHLDFADTKVDEQRTKHTNGFSRIPRISASKHELKRSKSTKALVLDPPAEVLDTRTLPQGSEKTAEFGSAQDEDRTPSPEVPSQTSRVTSIASEATVKATPMQDDPIMRDSAIILCRGNSGLSGMPLLIPIDRLPIICMMAHSIEYTGITQSDAITDVPRLASSSNAGARDGHNASPNTSPVRGRGKQYTPLTRRQTQSNVSLWSNPTSDLRATAVEFVPKHLQPVPEPSRPPLPEEWTQPPVPEAPFNPFKMDLYGVPLFYHMYDAAFWGFNNGGPSSPRRGKKKWSSQSPKRRGWKDRGEYANTSPTKLSRPEEPKSPSGHEGSASQEPDDGTPHATPVESARPEAAAVEAKASISNTSAEELSSFQQPASIGSTENAPFASQFQSIPKNPNIRNDAPVGRASRQIDWTRIRNVPSQPLYRRGAEYIPPHERPLYGQNSNTLPFRQHGRRGQFLNYAYQNPHQSYDGSLYNQDRSGGHRNRNWNTSVGIPLDNTEPFPDPVAPSGPRREGDHALRANVEGDSPKQYVGYAANKRKTCDHLVIKYAAEWGGALCHTCDP